MLMAVLTEDMYCYSVWFWAASGAAAIARSDAKLTSASNNYS